MMGRSIGLKGLLEQMNETTGTKLDVILVKAIITSRNLLTSKEEKSVERVTNIMMPAKRVGI